MPKPFLVQRKSGVYARFLIPLDLRPLIGSQYLVRPLRSQGGDHARLVAAQMAHRLSAAFDAYRGSSMSDEELKAMLSGLNALNSGKADKYKLKIGDFEIEVNGPEDHEMAKDMAKEILPLVIHARALAGNVQEIGRVAPDSMPIANPRGPSLSSRISAYIQDLKNAKTSVGNILDTRNTLEIFIELIGDRPVDGITNDHIRDFQTALNDWPSNARKKQEFKDLNAKQIVEAVQSLRNEGQIVQGLSDRTLAKHRDRIASFFNSLLQSGVIHRNPLNGIKRQDNGKQKMNSRRPFNASELDMIFASQNIEPWTKSKSHRKWGAWIGFYTGARVNEVAQLYVHNIAPEGDIYGFHIVESKPDQKLKTAGSKRFIPIHQDLIDAGFLDYVEDVKEAGHERLFPLLPHSKKAGYGDAMSDQFGTYIESLGISGTDIGFHSFRHKMVSELLSKDVPQHVVAHITGHGVSAPGSMGDYIHKETLLLRVDALSRFHGPHKPTPYKRGDAMEELTDAHRKIKVREANAAARVRREKIKKKPLDN